MSFALSATLARPMTRRAAASALAGLLAVGAGIRAVSAACGEGTVEIDGMCVPAVQDSCRDMGCGEGYRCVDGRCERIAAKGRKKKGKKAPVA